MISELQKCPSVFATGAERTTVMCCMTDTADELGVYAFSAANNMSFRHAYNETSLLAVKNRSGEIMSWARFFEILTDAFRCERAAVSISRPSAAARTSGAAAAAGYNASGAAAAVGGEAGGCEVQVVCTPSTGGTPIILTASRTSEGMQKLIISRMIKTQSIVAHPKEHQQRLAHLAADEAAVIAQKKSLEKEALTLKENLARNRSQEEASNKRLAELRREFKPMQSARTDDPWEAVRTKQAQSNTANAHRVLNPLIDRTSKDYDPQLVRLIKSRFLKPEDCRPTSPGCRVIQPYSPGELAKVTQSFVSRQHEVVWRALEQIDEWNYSVFDVQRAMSGDDFASLPVQPNGGSLFVTLYALLCKHNFLEKFNIDEQIALNWISAVEAGYHGNPYHNSMHAADVLQITHFILTKGGLIKRCELSDLDVFAALLAAAIHDYDHPGINNNFHIKSGSYLATLYNDRSVLENLHVSSVFELMKNPAFNLLASFTEEQRKEIRETMVEMVLATDMGLHGKYVARMKGKLQERATFLKREDQLLALSMALKMADISNCGRPNDIYIRWSGKIADEFYQQGDRERNLGMSCSPFMDRMQPALAKGQISFMNFIIIPFFDQLSELLPDLRFTVDLAEANKAYWAEHDDSAQNMN